MIAKVCNSSTDKNMTWIEEIDQASQDISDHLPAIANNVECRLIPLPASQVDVLRADDATFGLADLIQGRAASVSSRFQRLGHDRRPRCHRFQTAFVATRTQWTFLVYADMSDIARRTITAAMDFSIGNNASSNPGSYFDKNKVIDSGAIPSALFP